MFIKNNRMYKYVETPENILNNLPNQVYTLEFDKETGFGLKLIADKFNLPEKIYSHKNETAVFNLCDIFINDFNRRDTNLGVLLNGIKGTGKSLLLNNSLTMYYHAVCLLYWFRRSFLLLCLVSTYPS